MLPGDPMAEAITAFDWSRTALGPMTSWQPALRVALDMVMSSRFPTCLMWGGELIALYNNAFLSILGYRQRSLGQPFSLIWPEAWGELAPIVSRALIGEATFVEDFPLDTTRHGHREHAYFTFCHSPVRDETGAIVGVLNTVVETTVQVDARNRLRGFATDLAEQVRAGIEDRDRMWQLSSDLMVIGDLQGTIIAVNPAWTQMLGWSESELLGRSYIDFLHPEDTAAARQRFAANVPRDGTVSVINRYRCKDGAYCWISWRSVVSESRITAVGRDITENKRHEEALRQAEDHLRQSQKMEAVGQLTGGLAHDFNNLLAGITGSLELLQRRIAARRFGELDRYVGAAHHSAKRAAALTHRLLAFARRQTLEPKPVRVEQLVSGMAELIRRTTGPHIALEVIATASPWLSLIDPHQLESALLNLCLNACDAMPDGGSLRIEIANMWLDGPRTDGLDISPGPYVVLSVEDSGTGMPPEVVRRAFDPFFTTKPLGMGTGLGLSMIYGFVRQSGGQAHIYSEVGKGTTVRLYLPRYLGEAAEEEEVPALHEMFAPATDKTILLIDDEPTVRMLIADVLRELGYAVAEAANGPEGLAVLDAGGSVDLLITDVGLPGGLNGRQVADAVRARHAHVKVLFITGYVENTVLSADHPDGNLHILKKPFPMDDLTQRVRVLLHASA